ncbi:MAG: hypothetical protein H6574_16940 [Lewinellaceae bacterium]|nr:hypothetical protein [Saprospiraceae bacterium]MCB9332760.1 hypothetical protein [Lewinellaceae bacterium]
MPLNQPVSNNKALIHPFPLIDRLSDLPLEQQELLLSDVLRGQIRPEYMALAHRAAPLFDLPAFLLPGPAEQLLQLLILQPPLWFDNHQNFLERTFLIALQENNERLLARLKALIAGVRSGLSNNFFKKILAQPQLNKQHELDLWLLRVKILEGKSERPGFVFDLPRAAREINPEEKPHLAPVILYAFRKTSPLAGIRLLVHFLYPKDKLVPDESWEWQYPYILAYARECFYYQLKDKIPLNYGELKALFEPYPHNHWLKMLYQEILSQPEMIELQAWYEENKQQDAPALNIANQLNEFFKV